MPITPDRLSRLREFGLSEYAARAYLALLDLGVAEARDVSTLSKVPQAKIYHVLEQLHEKGLAVILPEFPKKYAPVPFSEYLDRLHDEHDRAAQAISRDREILAEMFRVVGDTEVGNRGFFTVIRGRRNVLTKIQEMVTEAKRDVLVVGTAGFASRHQGLSTELDDAKRRGVRLRALVPVTTQTAPKLEELAQTAEVRARDVDDGSQSSRVAILVVDGVRAFLINFLPDDDNLYAGKDIGVFTDQEAMVAALGSLVEPHWQLASPFDQRREELVTGRVGEFTRVYTTRAEAVAALRESLERGLRTLRAFDAQPAERPSELTRDLANHIRAAGATYRALVNVADATSGASLQAIAAESPGSQLRHHAPRASTTRYWVLDDREAFFSIAQEGAVADPIVVHTTTPGIVASLARHFDAAWARGIPLDARLEEMERFPHIQPRDVGLGPLFDETREAVLVVNERGRVVLWNDAATRAFGHAVDEALGLAAGALLPDAVAAVLDGATGSRTDVLAVSAFRKDGSAFGAEVTVIPAAEPVTGHRYAIVVVREAAPGRRVGVVTDEPVKARRS